MNTRIAAAAALTLTAALALSACTSAGGDMNGMHHDMTPSATSSADENTADLMFVTMMIPHHQQAVEMSDMLLAKSGVDPKVAELAQKIKAAQSPEIEKMRGWLDAWGAEQPSGGMDHTGGMMSQDDMDALKAASGRDASTLFLTQMIQHHEGAITMAQSEIAKGRNADVLALAKAIVEAQQAEIALMKEMLGQ